MKDNLVGKLAGQDDSLQVVAFLGFAGLSLILGYIAVRYLLIAYGLLIAPFVVLLGLFLLKKPIRALFAFILVLPIHSLLITVLFVQMGLPAWLARVASGWKEALLLAAFVVATSSLFVQRMPIRLTSVDWIAILWLCQIAVYFLFQNGFSIWEASLTARLYGARDWLLILMPYVIGRLVFVPKERIKQIFKAILLVGLVTSIVGIVEYFLIPTEWHVRLGVPQYFSELLGLHYPSYLLGLPANYWIGAEFGGARRAVSTYLSGQGFAVPFLIILPLAGYNCFSIQLTRRSGWVFLLCSLALLLTITRMTIVVCFIQIMVLLWLLRKRKTLLRIISIVVILFSIALLVSPFLRDYVIQTVLLQDTSAHSRPQQIREAMQMLFHFPLGLGLGSTGQAGARFGLSGAGTETGYTMITGALGLPGLLLFLAWFVGILAYSFWGYQHFQGIWQGLALVVFVTALGYLLNNFTAPPNQSPFAVYVFSWLAGLVVQRFSYPVTSSLENG